MSSGLKITQRLPGYILPFDTGKPTQILHWTRSFASCWTLATLIGGTFFEPVGSRFSPTNPSLVSLPAFTRALPFHVRSQNGYARQNMTCIMPPIRFEGTTPSYSGPSASSTWAYNSVNEENSMRRSHCATSTFLYNHEHFTKDLQTIITATSIMRLDIGTLFF